MNGSEELGVSIVIPCYNEGGTIADAIERVVRCASGRFRAFEVIAVDDGSTDDTPSALQASSVKRADLVRVVSHPENRGLTQAMISGADAARFRTVAFLDADLSYVPETIGALVEARAQASAVAAIASPYMRGGAVRNVPRVRLIASRVANVLLSCAVGGRIRTFTGMVRAYDRSFFRSAAKRAGAGEFNAAMIAELMRRGSAFVEVPAILAWPAARYESAPRLSWASLWKRTLLVFETVRVLTASRRVPFESIRYGPLVLIHRPKRP